MCQVYKDVFCVTNAIESVFVDLKEKWSIVGKNGECDIPVSGMHEGMKKVNCNKEETLLALLCTKR